MDGMDDADETSTCAGMDGMDDADETSTCAGMDGMDEGAPIPAELDADMDDMDVDMEEGAPIPAELYCSVAEYLDCQTLLDFCRAIGRADGGRVGRYILCRSGAPAGQVRFSIDNPYARDLVHRFCRPPSPPPVETFRVPNLRPMCSSCTDDYCPWGLQG